mgnify:CR=1 FL=1
MKLIKFISLFALLTITCQLLAQKSHKAVVVDKNGVMRDKKTKAEIKGFGVNYTLPFAHAWRAAKTRGIDPKQAMLNDIYHFSRLGFDLYRVHVWDTEISDSVGNLLNNEHLDAFDFLLARLKYKGFNAIITPIAFWGNGWPEPDEPTGSFSMKYGKTRALTDPEAIKAQQNYLRQFLNHVNPYTGLAYKDEPMILAFEVSNEPHHSGEAAEVTRFVSAMVEAIRSTGTAKPVFYNISHAVHFADAYFKGGIQGGTFQWYPTGLGYKNELEGNLLPNVDNYDIPFDSVIRKHNGAKIVYEFDAADVNKSYIYPAMARSFRTAGIQLATHFAYDPTFLASTNTEYNTHYMNLAYTPGKALALMIASHIFHEMPLYASFGKYPHDTIFQDVTISYKNDLALLNTAETYIHTNNTAIVPKAAEKLTKIAGCGSSPIITYNGTGAYFLDKLSEGVWRLEVMPDPIAVDNPFGRNSPDKKVSLIQWTFHPMQINLKNLGREFSIKGINEGNKLENITTSGYFVVGPGTYLLMRKDALLISETNAVWGKNHLNDFYAPAADVEKAWYSHQAVDEADADETLQLQINYIAISRPVKTELIAYLGNDYRNLPVQYVAPGKYTASIPKDMMKKGILHYYIVITGQNKEVTTWPGAIKGHPWDWNFTGTTSYQTRVVPASFPIHLFDACKDADKLVREWKPGLQLKPSEEAFECVYEVNLKELFSPDIENLSAKPIYDYSFRHGILTKIKHRKTALEQKKNLIIKAKSLTDLDTKIQIALISDDGSAWGTIVTLKPQTTLISININDLKPVATVTLPRPYPSFLPYYFDHANTSKLDLSKIEGIQISVGPGLGDQEQQKAQSFGIISISIE